MVRCPALRAKRTVSMVKANGFRWLDALRPSASSPEPEPPPASSCAIACTCGTPPLHVAAIWLHIVWRATSAPFRDSKNKNQKPHRARVRSYAILSSWISRTRTTSAKCTPGASRRPRGRRARTGSSFCSAMSARRPSSARQGSAQSRAPSWPHMQGEMMR
jgi:hypothetical protein